MFISKIYHAGNRIRNLLGLASLVCIDYCTTVTIEKLLLKCGQYARDERISVNRALLTYFHMQSIFILF